ncbi:MAG: hypothetical protein EHM13_14725 [Acidobacteria bacterium]|nr:MAG: hypothetical protein EHM13_14725 [Acidobacteriota bacterium]
MPEPCKVLISSRQLSSPLIERGELQGEVLTFGVSEPLRALETITTRHPEMILLDHKFAASERGLAFIEGIQADPKLEGSAVLLVLDDGTVSRYTTLHPDRRAPRIRIAAGRQLVVDGKDADLVDLSVLGAQVVSVTALRPGKAVRVVLRDDSDEVKMNAEIAWARYEISKKPYYRAGIMFKDPDPAAVLRYCTRNAAENQARSSTLAAPPV